MATDFFDKRSDSSALKAQIVVKYLVAWGRVVAPRADEHVVYFDPFCGRGAYRDGSRSTPLLVIEAASSVQALREKLMIVFRDAQEAYCFDLTTSMAKMPETGAFAHRPIAVCEEVDAALGQQFAGTTLSPTFAFLDPCGYKGLTLELINSLVKDWGCDCLIFFNYSRINAALTNPKVRDHMEALFSPSGLVDLRERVKGQTPRDREWIAMRFFEDLLLNQGPSQYVRWFRFLRSGVDRTSHYLMFVSKSFRGYDIMKQIMAAEGKFSPEGVPLFEFDPQEPDYVQTGLFDESRLDDLAKGLMDELPSRMLNVQEIYRSHSPGTDYIPDNYKSALRSLEEKGVVRCDPPAIERPMRKGVRTMADGTLVTFPR